MKSKTFMGTLLIVLGILFLLFNFEVIQFTSAMTALWPVGLILVGISLIFKQKAIAAVLLIFTIVLGIGHIVNSIDFSTDSREVVQKVGASTVGTLKLQAEYGAGTVKVSKGTPFNLVKNTVTTADIKDPEFKYSENEGEATLKISRRGSSAFMGHQTDYWDIEVSPDPVVELELDYGAAEADVDLSGLKVSKLSIETGASSTTLKFARYPTQASLDMGANSLELLLPKGYPSIIEIDSGLTSLDFTGFTKDGNTYTNDEYKEGEPAISIKINAGVSSIEGDYYE